jgi:hypothetical protein
MGSAARLDPARNVHGTKDGFRKKKKGSENIISCFSQNIEQVVCMQKCSYGQAA